jgi:hypothetical protein
VTNQTSMLVLDDEGFAEHGVERLNEARTETEHDAQASGASQATTTPVTRNPGTSGNYDSDDVSYGGALDPTTIGLVLAWLLGSRRRAGVRR